MSIPEIRRVPVSHASRGTNRTGRGFGCRISAGNASNDAVHFVHHILRNYSVATGLRAGRWPAGTRRPLPYIKVVILGTIPYLRNGVIGIRSRWGERAARCRSLRGAERRGNLHWWDRRLACLLGITGKMPVIRRAGRDAGRYRGPLGHALSLVERASCLSKMTGETPVPPRP